MISIQSVMLVCLGFFVAILLGLIIAPAFWTRAVRLTTQRLKAALPVNEAEIRADKDRLRAEYAVKVHQLETQVEQAKLGAARQLIELNRRDAAISQLETRMGEIHSSLEENQNARRVLEQTITDRLPKVEARLSEAKQLLNARDREIAELNAGGQKQRQSLDEAAAVIAQLQAEIQRLRTNLATAEARNRGQFRDPHAESQVAMRSEVEALRARARDQSSVIDRLAGNTSSAAPNGAKSRVIQIANDAALPSAGGAASQADADQLRRDLAATELALGQAKTDAAARQALESEAKAMRAKADDQAGEIARLQAELAAITEGAKEDRRLSIKDSKLGLKAKLGGLSAKSDQQTETIQRLRSELAAANERSARQATYFMDQMRRLGAGTSTHSEPRTRTGAAQTGRRSSGERLAPVRAGLNVRTGRASKSNEEQSGVPSGPAGDGLANGGPPPVAVSSTARPPMHPEQIERVNGFLKALGEGSIPDSAVPPLSLASASSSPPARATDGKESAVAAAASEAAKSAHPAASDRIAILKPGPGSAPAPAAGPAADADRKGMSEPKTETSRRGRLLDRLTSIDKG